MDDPCMDHYEKQLYSVFKSFDVNNEESLDESAVNNLCDALQLEERGAALVDTLFERRSDRVTFTQFRSGLLAVLGEPASAPSPSPPDPTPAPAPHSDDDSGHELAPRFVFGAKKYGRRSRPQQGGAGAPARAASASRAQGSERAPRFRRSVSAMERRDPSPPALDHDTRIGRDDALALCAELRMPALDRRLVDRIFEDSPAPHTTVGEFFERLDRELAGAVRAAGGPLDEDDPERGLAADRLAELWEGAGVRHPRRLLAQLGLAGPAPRAADVERALDDELRAAEEPLDARGSLLAAALALARLRASAAARRQHRAAAERDGLRTALAGANERARLLAHEVDENHARIEGELRASLRRAEAARAEEARRAEAAAAGERERAAGERARLQAEAARAADGEARARAELAAERERADALEARALGAEERCAAAERAAARLAAQLREAEARGAGAEAARQAARAAEARAQALQADCQRLRDRADELAAALERAPAAPHVPGGGERGGTLSAELHSLLADNTTEEVAGGDAAVEEAAGGDAAEVERLNNLVNELERSLEAMRCEYEACEEYWAGKLADERGAHDAEARAAGDRLAELVARIAEFERRLLPPPAPALPTIPEAAALEAQVAHVEQEYARYRRAARARLAAAAAAAARPRPPAPAPQLAERCARAEGAVRRLHARLAAADLLVKELYVENCHLAHARPLPLAPL